MRLTDPGYLGDDEGLVRRVISTVVTVLGYVIFMGSLIAIMTQWLNQTIRKLEQGFTPIAQNNHILILGWTNRTPAIVEELMRSEGRVQRYLRRFRARGLQVVILAEDVSLERTQELREELGDLWDAKKITFRSGTPLRVEHLERVDFHHAGAIILPGADFAYGSADASDTRIIKTLLSVANHEAHDVDVPLPLLVTEIFDPSKVALVKQSYKGAFEVLASDVFIARCLAQNVRHPGLSRIFREILSHGEGSEIYVRTPDQFAGFTFGDLNDAYPKAVLLGVVRPDENSFDPLLNPPRDFVLEIGDRLVFLAHCYEDCDPPKNYTPKKTTQQPGLVLDVPVKPHWRILVLGWNHKAADLLAEFDSYAREQ
ncbi:MAG: CASTOR/POLLUX-related putative ion channel, partial [Candidatus Latescibacterota bacterium]